MPTLEVLAAAGPNAGGAPLGASEIASRQLFGTVLVVILFLTIVIYGMWVAAGVAAEKETRVMELLISAASPRQLVLGKVVGIGLAGLVQYLAILMPALVALALQEPAARLLGLAGGFEPAARRDRSRRCSSGTGSSSSSGSRSTRSSMRPPVRSSAASRTSRSSPCR